MCRKGVFLAFALVLALVNLSSVSANFVCGEVFTEEEISPGWFDVEISYTQNANAKTSCQISPGNNRFCCDPREIEAVNWDVGKEINARVYDQEKGYLSDTSSLIISGEGFDVFPILELRDAISVHSPHNRVFIDSSEFYLNASIDQHFDSIDYALNFSGEIVDEGNLCESCNHFEGFLNLSEKGQYQLLITARNPEAYMIEKIDLYNLDYLFFERKVACDGCDEGSVPQGSIANISISINSSHNITGELEDYFPSSWIFIDDPNKVDADFNNDGLVNVLDLIALLGSWGVCEGCIEDLNKDGIVDEIDLIILLSQWTGPDPPDSPEVSLETYYSARKPVLELASESHNKVSWTVSGKEAEKSYQLLTPPVFWPRKYHFFSEFEGFRGNEDIINVYRFLELGFLSLDNEIKESLEDSTIAVNYGSISAESPVFIKVKNELLKEVAVFPKSADKEVSVFLDFSPEFGMDGSEVDFSVSSDIENTNLDRLMVRHSVDKELLDEGKVLLLYRHDLEKKEWEEVAFEVYDEDEERVHLESYVERLGIFALKEVKRDFYE